MTTTALPFKTISSTATRIQSIDLLRGIVMIIMALDHVRDYFHADAFLFSPLDLEKTNAAIFFTRWITHFCAPIFVFLAGTSAFLVGTRKSKNELATFLVSRGLWLIFLEVTVMNFGWFFNIEFPLIVLQVIWALGFGMIALAAAVYLPYKAILVVGIIFIAGHNLLDGIHPEGEGVGAIAFSMLHEFHVFKIGYFYLFVGYPVIAWTGIMMLGYCFGKLYQPSVSNESRRKTLTWLGFSMIALFMIIRLINIYGDPRPWSEQDTALKTFFAFMNVNKYPPSLLYALITLGPAMLFLSIAENFQGRVSSVITALGRVPLFFYILHVYLIHLLAVVAAVLTGYDFSDMIFNTWVTDSPELKGYGFSLPVVYMVWVLIMAILFPLCVRYDRYKQAHKSNRLLSYL
jgi:uncharacterized membrane protein